MNKRGLLGKVLLLAAVVILVIVAIVYFTGTLRFNLGKGFSLDVNYEDEQDNSSEVEVIELPDDENIVEEIINDTLNNITEDFTNQTEIESNLTIENNNTLNNTNTSS